MGVMFDAVNPANIPAAADGGPALRITVGADLAGEAFDVEEGNTPAMHVAPAMAARLAKGWWSVGYVNESTFHELTAAMGPAGLSWADAEHFPQPGVYLWAADPDGNIAAGRWAVPVKPVAVQSRYLGDHDESDTADTFGATAAGYIDGAASEWPADAWARFRVLPGGGTSGPLPPPDPTPPPAPAPTPEVVNVQLPILAQGAQGASVKAVQTVLGGIAADGIFGPVTHARVVEYQTAHHLTPDGIVGLHTWGSLLGAPQ